MPTNSVCHKGKSLLSLVHNQVFLTLTLINRDSGVPSRLVLACQHIYNNNKGDGTSCYMWRRLDMHNIELENEHPTHIYVAAPGDSTVFLHLALSEGILLG